MAIPNLVSEDMTPQSVDEVLQHIATVRAALPFLIGIGPDERRTLSKPGDGGQGFVRKSYHVGMRIEGHLPRSFDLEEMRKDIECADGLSRIMIVLSQLLEKLTDTHALVSHEAYKAALLIYKHAKDVRGIDGLEQAVAELGARFRHRRSPVESTTADAPTADAE